MRHDTPSEVARELSKYAPRRMMNILDPAVGGGALLAPMLGKIASHGARVFCVDSDATAFEDLRKIPELNRDTVTCITADFLEWSQNARNLPEFDCVVMNPPFSGRKSDLRVINVSDDLEGCAERERSVPVEVAFLIRAIGLLRPGGRILAVLPCSLIMSEGLQWLRGELFRCGAIRYVHELPPRTFANVESRMYLFVFEKSARQSKVVLFNHDLADPERLDLPVRKDQVIRRLDFGYQRGMQMINTLAAQRDLGWRQLNEMAKVYRGTGNSPEGPKSSVHTTDFRAGYWGHASRHKQSGEVQMDRRIQRGDILVKRVGRHCRLSFGRTVGLQGMACSDCVIIVRPNNVADSTRLLFALRCLFSFEWSKALVERGTGATYISEESLRDLQIPMGLSKRFYGAFRDFSKAIASSTTSTADQAAQYVMHRLQGRLDKTEGPTSKNF